MGFECAFIEKTFMEELCWKYETKYTVVKPKRQQGRPPNLSILRIGKAVTQEAARARTRKGLPLSFAARPFSNPLDSVLPQSILSGYFLLLLHAPLSPSVDSL